MDTWDLRVLGPVGVVAGDGRPVALGGRRQRELLCLLLTARGRVVGVERLVDELWPDDPPPRAKGAVRTFVSDLRRALEADRGRPRVLVTEGAGYALRAPAENVDVRRVERWVEESRGAPPEEAARLLSGALAQWRGEPFEEFADAEWARAERAHLAELRVRTVERLAQARLDTGATDEAVAALNALVDTHPWREEAWRLLALGLYRGGRRRDALAALARARARLVDELGLDPDPRLAELEVGILRGDPALRSPSSVQDVWSNAAAAYASVSARSRLETTAVLISDLAVSGAVAAAARQRLEAIAAAERFGDPELTARVIGRFDVPGVWTRSDDPAGAAAVVAAAERTLDRLGDGGSRAARARLLATVAMESRGTADRGPEAREAERIARELGDPRLLCTALAGRLMQAFERTGLAAERHGLATEIIDLAVDHDLSTFEIHGRISRMQALGALGLFGDADAARVDALADTFDRPLARVFTALYRRMRDGGPTAEAAGILARSGMAGLAGGAAALVSLPGAAVPEEDLGPYAPWVLPWLAARTGDRVRARVLLDSVPDPPRDLLQEALWLLVLKAARLADHPGAERRATAALRPAAPERAAGSAVIDLGPIAPWLPPPDPR
ncbi:BTAD domain-containing putative transcriptional regulator [Nocardiopsis sp. CC223A]|uniref:AfsR/SARP family transcriptional regulator n=1 Tax=Nocardiopsis sp. CC223A TaxID=3044051 RepID=UPI00278C21DA|nr:BTAD domain-containing putative transcriptional regulator [Nocardiopsis sp. CC223A]